MMSRPAGLLVCSASVVHLPQRPLAQRENEHCDCSSSTVSLLQALPSCQADTEGASFFFFVTGR